MAPRTTLDCVVVGGGISGLAAAHRLVELTRQGGRTPRFRVLEGRDRVGGNIRTERVEGALLEGGPDQFVHHKPAGLALCKRLGLSDEVIEIDAKQTATHVVRGGRPERLPDGFTLMGPTRLLPLARSRFVSWGGLLRAAREPWIAPRPSSVQDESLGSFVTRRFGRELYDSIFEPVMGGIFLADTDRLSLDMTASQLLRLEREHGSILRAMRKRPASLPGRGSSGPPKGGCVSLRGGLDQLVRRLIDGLPPASVQTGTPVRAIRPEGGRWRIATERGEVDAASVVLACPAFEAARLLEWDRPLARELERLDYASCATVNLVYADTALARPLDGFGFFVGRSEGLPILACNYVSEKFPGRVPPGRVLLRTFLGGARDPGVLDGSDEDLVRTAHAAIAGLLGLEQEPSYAKACRFSRAMPQLDVGHRAWREGVLKRLASHAGIHPCGGLLGWIGLPDCIASGEEAARDALDRLQLGPSAAAS